jgi:ribosomal protein S18 acetylase RimI-like enzyme
MSLSASAFKLRKADLSDLPAVYRICLKTGNAGQDASATEDDPDMLGHLFAGPYVVLEPNFAFVLDGPNGVAGYVLGALDSEAFFKRMETHWLPPLRRRIPDPGFDPATWKGSDSWRRQLHAFKADIPASLHAYPSHGHIDFLPEARGLGFGRLGLERVMQELAEAGSPGLQLGVAPDNHSALAFYRKLGFTEHRADDTDPNDVMMVKRLA